MRSREMGCRWGLKLLGGLRVGKVGGSKKAEMGWKAWGEITVLQYRLVGGFVTLSRRRSYKVVQVKSLGILVGSLS